jgi:hypothetical protein
MGVWRHFFWDLRHLFRGKLVPLEDLCQQYLGDLFAEYNFETYRRIIDWSEETIEFRSGKVSLWVQYSLCMLSVEIWDLLQSPREGRIGLANLIRHRAGEDVAKHLATAVHLRFRDERVKEYGQVLRQHCRDVLAGDFAVRAELPEPSDDPWEDLRGNDFPC